MILLGLISGSPPVMPAPLASHSFASDIMSESVLTHHSLATMISFPDFRSERGQYQHFRPQSPVAKRTSLAPKTQCLHPVGSLPTLLEPWGVSIAFLLPVVFFNLVFGVDDIVVIFTAIV